MRNSSQTDSDPNIDSDAYILVEGPAWGDAEFYGRWLLAAATAEALWKEVLEKDPSFRKQARRILNIYEPDFRMAAVVTLKGLFDFQKAIFVSSTSPEGEELCMMIEMGFCARSGHWYKMTIPRDLTVTIVKAAVLRYCQTEDLECYLHPEYLLTTMCLAEAKVLQRRLQAIQEFDQDKSLPTGLDHLQ